MLIFTLNKAGTLINIRLVQSSGFPILDEEALRAVKVAAPFDPFPPQMGEDPWNIRAFFHYDHPRRPEGTDPAMPPFFVARTGLLISALQRRLFGRAPSRRDAPRTLRVSGITHDVWICRDEVGVPHIYAGSEGDLAFGLGFAMAQDRLWQMEMLRRLAGGRLAELVGDKAIGGGRSPHARSNNLGAGSALPESPDVSGGTDGTSTGLRCVAGPP